MTDMTVSGSASTMPQPRDDARRKQAFLDPSNDGVARSLAQRFAQRHTVTAVAVATIISFVVVAIVMVGIGLLITHVLAHGPLGSWDRHVSRWFDKQRLREWNRSSGDATNVADTFEVAGVAAVITIFLLVRKWGRRAFLLVAGLVIELSVFLVANVIVKRPRPTVHHLGGTPSTYGFPSGHTATTVVLYGGVAILVMVATTRRVPRIAAWTLAAVLTVCVALSRVYRGEHYPTDVISGFLLGVGSLASAVFILRVAGAARAERSGDDKKRSSPGKSARLDTAAS
jgi:membrane-associated phospholipid phosphatase